MGSQCATESLATSAPCNRALDLTGRAADLLPRIERVQLLDLTGGSRPSRSARATGTKTGKLKTDCANSPQQHDTGRSADVELQSSVELPRTQRPRRRGTRREEDRH